MDMVLLLTLAALLGAAAPVRSQEAAASGQAAPRTLAAGPLSGAVYAPDGRLLFTAGEDGSVKAWNRAEGRLVRTIRAHEEGVASLAISADGKHLGTGASDRLARVWDPATGRLLRSLEGHGDWVTVVAFLPGAFAGAGHDGAIKIWDLDSGAERSALKGHSAPVILAAGGPGMPLASASRDGAIVLWDPATGRRLDSVPAGGAPVTALALSPDGLYLAAAEEEVIRLRKLPDLSSLREMRGHSRAVHSLAFSMGGELLASGGYDGSARLWGVEEGRALMTREGPAGRVGVAMDPRGDLLAVAGERGAEIIDLSAVLEWSRYRDFLARSLASGGQGRWLQAKDEAETALKSLRTRQGHEALARAGEAISRERWRRLGEWTRRGLLGGAPLAAGGAALFWFLRVRRRRNALLARVVKLARGERAEKKKAYEAWAEYLEAGGSFASLSGEDLYAVYSSTARQSELMERVASVSTEQALDLARRMAEAGRGEEACDLLVADARFLPGLCGEGAADDVVRIFDDAGRLGALAKAMGSGASRAEAAPFAKALRKSNRNESVVQLLKELERRTPLESSLMAQALTDLGRHEEAGALSESVPSNQSQWSPDEVLFNFKINIKSGRLDRAEPLYKRVSAARPMKEDPEIHYAYALLLERSGRVVEAADIYRRFIAEDITFKDVVERFRNLKRTPAQAAQSAAAAAPPGPPSAPAETPAPALRSQAADAPSTGSRVVVIGGKYELGKSIGEGGMGIVYEGFHRALDRKVAVKKMRPEIRAVDRERRRFITEARVIARVNHPYIVAIHDIIDEGGELYLVFDYVEGKPLSGILDERDRLPIAECKTLLSYVCEAVDCAHRQNVLHRDLKPSNIMVHKDGFAKVMDFGLAREARETLQRMSQSQVDIAGTPAYMAPEQHLGDTVKASDVFSLGVCLYEMLSGQLPFRGPEFLIQKERMKFKPLTSVVQGLPKGVDPLMQAVLAGDPKKRIRNVLDFLDLVQSL